MTTDDIMALANKYAASNGKAMLEKLYGSSRSYTEQCTAEAFQDRQALRAAIETLRYEVDAIAAIKEERDNLQAADAIRFREAASCERAVRLEFEALVEALENAQAELLRSKAHAEMRRMDDEALMRQALNALDPPAQLRFGGTVKLKAAAIAALKERLK